LIFHNSKLIIFHSDGIEPEMEAAVRHQRKLRVNSLTLKAIVPEKASNERPPLMATFSLVGGFL
jgi:hypothetical protein